MDEQVAQYFSLFSWLIWPTERVRALGGHSWARGLWSALFFLSYRSHLVFILRRWKGGFGTTRLCFLSSAFDRGRLLRFFSLSLRYFPISAWTPYFMPLAGQLVSVCPSLLFSLSLFFLPANRPVWKDWILRGTSFFSVFLLFFLSLYSLYGTGKNEIKKKRNDEANEITGERNLKD